MKRISNRKSIGPDGTVYWLMTRAVMIHRAFSYSCAFTPVQYRVGRDNCARELWRARRQLRRCCEHLTINQVATQP